jgi:hypothetical protein
MKQIGFLVEQLLKPILKDYSPVKLIIKRNWEDIIGNTHYKYCDLDKVIFLKNKGNCGAIYIKIYNSPTSFFIENNKSVIIERINILFGYTIINSVKIKQEPKIIDN